MLTFNSIEHIGDDDRRFGFHFGVAGLEVIRSRFKKNLRHVTRASVEAISIIRSYFSSYTSHKIAWLLLSFSGSTRQAN
jgi:hypothetical protein